MEREKGREGRVCFDKVFVCANSLYSVVRQAQQWKLPLELRWRGRLQGNLYGEQEKWQGDALECSRRGAARAAAPIVVGRRQPYNCTSLSLPLKWLSLSRFPTPLSPLASTAACSIENFNLLCHNELCLRFSQLRQCLSLLLLLRLLLLQLRLLWRQRRRV